MSITERMERDGMTFQDAMDKEAGVSGARAPITLSEWLRHEALNTSLLVLEGLPPVAQAAMRRISQLMTRAAERIDHDDARFNEHFEAWKANNAWHARRIMELERLCAAQEAQLQACDGNPS